MVLPIFHVKSALIILHLPPSYLSWFPSRPLPESSTTDDSDETKLYQSWFKLVLEMNRLGRYESELMIL